MKRKKLRDNYVFRTHTELPPWIHDVGVTNAGVAVAGVMARQLGQQAGARLPSFIGLHSRTLEARIAVLEQTKTVLGYRNELRAMETRRHITPAVHDELLVVLQDVRMPLAARLAVVRARLRLENQ